MGAEHSGIVPVNAYILVRTERGRADDIARRLRKQVPHARVQRVDGVYDVVVALTADSTEYVTATVRDQLRPVSGVVEAEVLTWVDENLERPVPGIEARSPQADHPHTQATP